MEKKNIKEVRKMIRHTKRVTSPIFWKAGRKNHVWITSVNPGSHSKNQAIPLQVLLRDVLNLVDTGREARAVIKQGKILVDGVVRRDYKFGVGFMDVISVPAIKKNFRVVPYHNGLKLIEIEAKEANTKILKIISKQVISKGKIQITTHDGSNFLEVKAKVKDSLILKSGKVNKVLEMVKGALCLVFRGRQAGRMGKLLKLGDVVQLEGNKEIFEVPIDYIMVIGEKTPVVKLYETTND